MLRSLVKPGCSDLATESIIKEKFVLGRRPLWLGIALLLFLIITIFGLVQSPRPLDDEHHFPGWLNWLVYPIETNSFLRQPLVTADLHGVWANFEDDQVHVWVVGDGGIILQSDDAGDTWTRQSATWPTSQFVGSPEAGPALSKGSPEQANDARPTPPPAPPTSPARSSARWPLMPEPTSETPFVINLLTIDLSGHYGIAGGDGGALIQNIDGAWKAMPTPTKQPIVQVFNHAERGYSIIEDSTGEAFKVSTPQQSEELSSFSSAKLTPEDDKNDWHATLDGRIYARNSNNDPRNDSFQSPVPVHAIHSLDDLEMLAAGDDGSILIWYYDVSRRPPILIRHAGGATVALRGIHFATASIAFAVGDEGTILRTEDSGYSWTQLTARWSAGAVPNELRTKVLAHNAALLNPGDISHTALLNEFARKKFPAPWYYPALCLVGLCLLPARKPPESSTKPKESGYVENTFISDRPLEPNDPDPLQLGSLARGLSRYVRHEKTRPPLAIAITGPWGCGKSSLMNLLKCDCERFGLRPVWFNAWHYQQEDHLLAALLERVRDEAVPPWWSPGTLGFRANLLWIRWRRRMLLGIAAACVLVWAAGDAFSDLPGLKETIGKITGIVGYLRAVFEGKLEPDITTPGYIAAVLASLAVVVRAMTAFGVRPAALMTTLSNGIKVHDIEAQVNVRKQFASEFRDVTRALGERNLLIFIDDLDRCRPEAVLNVLEAVNFLVSSGDCFIVLGMDPKVVEICVGLAFEKVAAEREPDKLPQIARKDFAHGYLDKLIQIQVRVPPAQPTRSVEIVAPPGAEEKGRAARERLATFKRAVTIAVAVAILITLFFNGVDNGNRNTLRRKRVATPTTQPLTAAATTTGSTTQPVGTPVYWPAPTTRAVTADLYPPKPPTRAGGVVFVIAALGVVVALTSILLTSVDPGEKDSEEFVEALRRWHPLTHSNPDVTPRAIKRFVNRIRFLAMRTRPNPQFVTRGEKISAWIACNLLRTPLRAPPREQAFAIKESDLVAIASVEQALGTINSPAAATVELVSTAEVISLVLVRHEDIKKQLADKSAASPDTQAELQSLSQQLSELGQFIETRWDQIKKESVPNYVRLTSAFEETIVTKS